MIKRKSEVNNLQESFLMASISNDKALIHELTEGCKDIHSLTAYMSYPDKIPRDTPIKDIKEKYHELRALAKKIEFAINSLKLLQFYFDIIRDELYYY